MSYDRKDKGHAGAQAADMGQQPVECGRQFKLKGRNQRVVMARHASKGTASAFTALAVRHPSH